MTVVGYGTQNNVNYWVIYIVHVHATDADILKPLPVQVIRMAGYVIQHFAIYILIFVLKDEMLIN
jgi:hypothetical protein